MDLVEAYYWNNNEPAPEDCGGLYTTFSYLAKQYIKEIGVRVEENTSERMILAPSIIIHIDHWYTFAASYVGFENSCALKERKIQQTRKELLNIFEAFRVEYRYLVSLIEKILPQPIAEEITPHVSLVWKFYEVMDSH